MYPLYKTADKTHLHSQSAHTKTMWTKRKNTLHLKKKEKRQPGSQGYMCLGKGANDLFILSQSHNGGPACTLAHSADIMNELTNT